MSTWSCVHRGVQRHAAHLSWKASRRGGALGRYVALTGAKLQKTRCQRSRPSLRPMWPAPCVLCARAQHRNEESTLLRHGQRHRTPPTHAPASCTILLLHVAEACAVSPTSVSCSTRHQHEQTPWRIKGLRASCPARINCAQVASAKLPLAACSLTFSSQSPTQVGSQFVVVGSIANSSALLACKRL